MTQNLLKYSYGKSISFPRYILILKYLKQWVICADLALYPTLTPANLVFSHVMKKRKAKIRMIALQRALDFRMPRHVSLRHLTMAPPKIVPPTPPGMVIRPIEICDSILNVIKYSYFDNKKFYPFCDICNISFHIASFPLYSRIYFERRWHWII